MKNKNTGKVKLVLFIALAIVVLLAVICVVQIVSINANKRALEQQQNNLNNLYDQHEYYDSFKDASKAKVNF